MIDASTNGHIKLNLGSGRVPLEGYRNLDGYFGDSLYPLNFSDDSVDEVRAVHILEHFGHRQTYDILREWVRVLKPGAWIKLAVPDFRWIAESYLTKRSTPPEGHAMKDYLMGSQVNEADFHKSIFDLETLNDLMKQVGLTEIQPWVSEITDCAALPVSLNLKGRKLARYPALINLQPEDERVTPTKEAAADGNGARYVAGQFRPESELKKERVKISPVAIVTSTPRYGSLIACDTIWTIAQTLQTGPARGGGAWWEQGLTRQIEAVLETPHPNGEPYEFIITADFDTYAHPNDGLELIKLLYENPQLDCVVSTQIRRGAFEEILAATSGPVDLTQPIIPIITGHFGLTAFRRRVFERLNKPWFLNIHDPNGAWGEGRVDADIFFWRKFVDQGFKAGMATQVVVGHGDEHICWPRVENGKVVKLCQSVYDWLKTRRPPDGVMTNA